MKRCHFFRHRTATKTWVLTDPDGYVIGEFIGFNGRQAWFQALNLLPLWFRGDLDVRRWGWNVRAEQ